MDIHKHHLRLNHTLPPKGTVKMFLKILSGLNTLPVNADFRFISIFHFPFHGGNANNIQRDMTMPVWLRTRKHGKCPQSGSFGPDCGLYIIHSGFYQLS